MCPSASVVWVDLRAQGRGKVLLAGQAARAEEGGQEAVDRVRVDARGRDEVGLRLAREQCRIQVRDRVRIPCLEAGDEGRLALGIEGRTGIR